MTTTPPRPGLVPILGTRRRLDALAALGHTATTIAAAMGRPAGSARALISSWRHRDRQWIEDTTADAVAQVYNQLAHRPGTNPVVRVHALRAGCLPPAAWDGLDIDDPNTDPTTEAAAA